uniref:Uncharacterized protein n=1 Tax=Physcomitrium patens TaxID=3218 RepID=A0A2K1IMD7_PHYPA|nr:hypothetical protein PHYPA_026755 [Physcomitrium patens]
MLEVAASEMERGRNCPRLNDTPGFSSQAPTRQAIVKRGGECSGPREPWTTAPTPGNFTYRQEHGHALSLWKRFSDQSVRRASGK